MCYTITSENFLATLFVLNKQKTIAFSKLNQYKVVLEKSFNYEVYVDVTSDSLLESVEDNADIFRMKRQGINLTTMGVDSFKDWSFFVDNFYHWIPEKVRDTYLSKLKEIMNE